eukprot:jgi/Chlat1/2748/Chrsp187S02900
MAGAARRAAGVVRWGFVTVGRVGWRNGERVEAAPWVGQLHRGMAGEARNGQGETHFGYRTVPEQEKSRLVGGVFESVAPSYDTMNDLMSGGLHRLWKDRFVNELKPFPGMTHLDVAGGTGKRERVAARLKEAHRRSSSLTGASSRVIISDINEAMLEVGRDRAEKRGLLADPNVVLDFRPGDAEDLSPLCANDSVDAYTIAFGIRNVTRPERALQEAFRVLRKGGRFLCLEFSRTNVPGLAQLYELYSFNAIPLIGQLVANDREAYQYLVESIRRFPPQSEFADMITKAGFARVEYENLLGGIVAIHSGFKL